MFTESFSSLMDQSLPFNVPCGKVCSDVSENIWIDNSYDGWLIEMNLPHVVDNFSSPTRASMSSGCFSTESTNSSFTSTRRCSTVSPMSSTWSEDLATPPVTPQSSGQWITSTPRATFSQSLARLNLLNDSFTDSHGMTESELWFPNNGHLPLLPAVQQKRAIHCFGDHRKEEGDILPTHPHTVDPAISRQIFSDPICSQGHQTPSLLKTSWSSTTNWSRPQTIAPRATIQSLLPSSPLTKIETSSPIRVESFEQRICELDSSPLPLPSPRFVPSQHNVEDIQRADASSMLMPQPLLTRRTQERNARRPHQRKLLSSSSDRPRRAVPSIACDSVIPQNTFACSFPGCIEKSTGRPRRFKRQEHRKRHELTVHNGVKKFICWVPGCSRGFTRTDNLGNHIKKTHGKNNSAQRNRYVATLDVSSEYYDPDWEGGLTEDGYPLIPRVTLCRCWVPECGKLYHLEDKLHTHLVQHYGKISLSHDGSSVNSLAEDDELFDSGWEEKVAVHDSPDEGL